jgi:hypothetical protein
MCTIGGIIYISAPSLVTLVAGSLNHTPPIAKRRWDPYPATWPITSSHKSVSNQDATGRWTLQKQRVYHTISIRAAYEGGVTDKKYRVMAGLRCYKGVNRFSPHPPDTQNPSEFLAVLRV